MPFPDDNSKTISLSYKTILLSLRNQMSTDRALEIDFHRATEVHFFDQTVRNVMRARWPARYLVDNKLNYYLMGEVGLIFYLCLGCSWHFPDLWMFDPMHKIPLGPPSGGWVRFVFVRMIPRSIRIYEPNLVAVRRSCRKRGGGVMQTDTHAQRDTAANFLPITITTLGLMVECWCYMTYERRCLILYGVAFEKRDSICVTKMKFLYIVCVPPISDW